MGKLEKKVFEKAWENISDGMIEIMKIAGIYDDFLEWQKTNGVEAKSAHPIKHPSKTNDGGSNGDSK